MYKNHFIMHEASQKTEKVDYDLTGDEMKINRPPNKRKIFLSRLKRRIFKHVWLVRIFLIVGVLVTFGLVAVLGFFAVSRSSSGAYLGLARNFLLTPSDSIKAHEGRTNFLILGKGGEGHEAPDLTDTIIFASISHTKPSMSLISLPRDIWIYELRAKLNSIYYWGNKKEPQGGMILAKATVEEIVNQPVHYTLVLDFSGFKKVIDVLGGIEVQVEHSFVDNRYPISGRENDLCEGDLEYKCRYETISFEKGEVFMDGETALKFVRSRNAEGDEGTDLARAARQERVIEAVKEKITSSEILLSPRKLLKLKEIGLESVETDMPNSSAAVLARRAVDARDNLNSHVLPEYLLENPPISLRFDNLYVFIPRAVDVNDPTGRSWSEIQEWVQCVITEKTDCAS